jgi:hypothetical protein
MPKRSAGEEGIDFFSSASGLMVWVGTLNKVGTKLRRRRPVRSNLHASRPTEGRSGGVTQEVFERWSEPTPALTGELKLLRILLWSSEASPSRQPQCLHDRLPSLFSRTARPISKRDHTANVLLDRYERVFRCTASAAG